MSLSVHTSGSFVSGVPHVKVSGEWKAVKVFYCKSFGDWENGFSPVPAVANITMHGAPGQGRTYRNLYEVLDFKYRSGIPKTIIATLTGEIVGKESYGRNRNPVPGNAGLIIDSRLAGHSIKIINNAIISGGGGECGQPGYVKGSSNTKTQAYPGGIAGPGLITEVPVAIDNQGTIQGGGGGGGSAYINKKEYYGGAGAGYGRALSESLYGTISAPGGFYDGRKAGEGGLPGEDGKTINNLPVHEITIAAGGVGGASVIGNRHITWINQGKITGRIEE